jgi:hypothetical protein
MAELVREAGASTTSWSITLDSHSIRLNVGSVRVAYFASETVWWAAVGGKASNLPEAVRDVSKKNVIYASVTVPSRGYLVDARLVRAIPAFLRKAAINYVAEAGSRRGGRSTWSRSHSPGVLAFLEAFLDTRLPRPEAAVLTPASDDVFVRGRRCRFVETRSSAAGQRATPASPSMAIVAAFATRGSRNDTGQSRMDSSTCTTRSRWRHFARRAK